MRPLGTTRTPTGRDGVGLGAADYVVADRVALEPGRGALVRATQPDGSTSGTIYLVTDLGIKFPIADGDPLASLGYGGRRRATSRACCST